MEINIHAMNTCSSDTVVFLVKTPKFFTQNMIILGF